MLCARYVTSASHAANLYCLNLRVTWAPYKHYVHIKNPNSPMPRNISMCKQTYESRHIRGSRSSIIHCHLSSSDLLFRHLLISNQSAYFRLILKQTAENRYFVVSNCSIQFRIVQIKIRNFVEYNSNIYRLYSNFISMLSADTHTHTHVRSQWYLQLKHNRIVVTQRNSAHLPKQKPNIWTHRYTMNVNERVREITIDAALALNWVQCF